MGMRWIGWVVAGLAVCASACASSGAVPRPFPLPKGSEPASTPIPSARPATAVDTYALVGTALALRGAPYRNGGSDPNGFDCSGFTQYVFAQYGVSLPREVREQYRLGQSIDPSDLAPGDLVFFSTTDASASHVAIVIGGDQFIHAPSSNGVVRVERLSSSYWNPRIVAVKRIL